MHNLMKIKKKSRQIHEILVNLLSLLPPKQLPAAIDMSSFSLVDILMSRVIKVILSIGLRGLTVLDCSRSVQSI